MCSLLKQAIVLLDGGRANRVGNEEGEMNYYMDFEPYLIRECNHQMHNEVNSLQLM
jgi:hypothetical protein